MEKNRNTRNTRLSLSSIRPCWHPAIYGLRTSLCCLIYTSATWPCQESKAANWAAKFFNIKSWTKGGHKMLQHQLDNRSAQNAIRFCMEMCCKHRDLNKMCRENSSGPDGLAFPNWSKSGFTYAEITSKDACQASGMSQGQRRTHVANISEQIGCKLYIYIYIYNYTVYYSITYSQMISHPLLLLVIWGSDTEYHQLWHSGRLESGGGGFGTGDVYATCFRASQTYSCLGVGCGGMG